MKRATPKPKPASSNSELRSLSDMMKLTGLGIGKFQQAAKEGFISSNSKKQYPQGATLLGMIKFLSSKAETLPSYDNVSQCSAATGIPVAVIKNTRRKSKQGFTNQMVQLGPLLRAIFESDALENQDWKKHKEKHDALLAEIKFKDADKKTLDRDDASMAIRRGVSIIFSSLYRYAQIEWPPQLKGLVEHEISAKLTEGIRTFETEAKAELLKFDQPEPSPAEVETIKTENQ